MQVITTERLPIKMWLDTIEDGALEQAKNLANLPFAYKWVAIMPDAHGGYGMPIGGVLATQEVVIPNAVGLDIGCFTGETKIPLLDGTQKTLKELTDRTDPFWVYSIDENYNLVPGKAIAVKTRKDADLVEVVVSGDESIVCTPNHLFMLDDRTWCEAYNLKPQDSLMPLCRTIYRTYVGDGKNYTTTPMGEYVPTSKQVGEYIYGGQTRYTCNICSLEIKGAVALDLHKRYKHGKHSVISVTPIDGKDTVYCLQVEDYHNFWLSAGAFVCDYK